MQHQITESERDATFKRLQGNPDNSKCLDCDKKNPKWSSVYLGIYLCLDCAGKHREYGVQTSFVRSINLDTWNQKYMTFMELGGNTKAHEYFLKQGLKTPYDYKSSTAQKYKQDLARKAEAVLASNSETKKEEQPIFTPQPDQEQTQKVSVEKSAPKETENPFANNIVLNKTETKTKGFSVEFSKNKPTFSSNKGRLAAKKIDNIDLDALSLNEDGGPTTYTKNKFEMSSDPFPMQQKNGVKQIESKGNNNKEETNTERLKQFQNAKAISSEAFKNHDSYANASNVRKFAGSNAISSDMYFGRRQEEDESDEIDLREAAQNIGNFLSDLGQQIRRQVDDDWNF